MRERFQCGRRAGMASMRAVAMSALCLLMAAGLGGCRKNVRVLVLPSTLTPVQLDAADAPDEEVDEVPLVELGPLSPEPTIPPPRRRPAAAPKEEPPAQAASPAEPAAMAIGTLSTGGDATPQSQQRVQDLIASIGKRISSLSSTVAAAKRRQVGQVKNFLEQAQQALNSGDTDGATNLATKARLLMDEVEKQ